MSVDTQVTIGLPVYNNARYIGATLESVLAQEFKNFILLICDDGSTDGTEALCRQFAEQDKRIRYIRNESNLGPLENHRKVLDLAETEYFMFARGHEILPSDLLDKAMTVLAVQPGVVLACAPVRWIDEQGELINDRFLSQFDSRGCDVVTRCLLVLWSKCEAFYGVGKTRDFRSVRALEPIVGTDLIMLLEMAILGSFAVIPSGDRLRRFYYTESYSGRIQRHRKALIRNPGLIDRFFPVAKLPFYIFGSVWRSDMNFVHKLAVTFLVLVCAPVKYLLSRGKTQKQGRPQAR